MLGAWSLAPSIFLPRRGFGYEVSTILGNTPKSVFVTKKKVWLGYWDFFPSHSGTTVLSLLKFPVRSSVCLFGFVWPVFGRRALLSCLGGGMA